KSNEELQRSGGSFKWCFEALRATDYILKKRNIKNINIPILLFQSGKDTFVRERGQNKFCKCANICNKIKFENAKHEIFFENDEIFIEYLKEIKKFLQ
ncbi:serine aminopeptidase domain-containing protein, partial [uncultured Clostridium sp.]